MVVVSDQAFKAYTFCLADIVQCFAFRYSMEIGSAFLLFFLDEYQLTGRTV